MPLVLFDKKEKSHLVKVLQKHTQALRMCLSTDADGHFLGSIASNFKLASTFGISEDRFLAFFSEEGPNEYLEALSFIRGISGFLGQTESEFIFKIFFFSGNFSPKNIGFSSNEKDILQKKLRHSVLEFRDIERYRSGRGLDGQYGPYLTKNELASRAGWSVDVVTSLLGIEPYPEFISSMELVFLLSKGLDMNPSDLVNRLFTWYRMKTMSEKDYI